MSSNKSKVNPKYTPVGAFLEKQEQDKEGRPQYYIKIDKDTVVTVNGKKVSAINISRPADKFERMLTKGVISAEECEEKVAKYDKDGDLSFVKFELTANLEDKK